MKVSKFSLRGPSVWMLRMFFIVLRGEEGVPVAEICREAGISQATYFTGARSMWVRCRRR